MNMKPETLARRAAARRAETIRSHRESVVRCAEAVARHERNGDLKRAAFYAELLVECQERLDAALALYPEVAADFDRATHVVVGDHDPELRRSA